MTGEPTVPVPISDLLAFIDEFEHYDVVGWGDPDEQEMIVRGVRDLAARVEPLEKALDQASTNLAVRSPDESRDDTTVGYQARLWKAALLAGWGGPLGFPFDDAGQSTTETPS